jgi:hypothetical protein
MRTIVGSFICLTALASLAVAATESSAPPPAYHLHGYYKLREQVATWQVSDDSPWQVVKDEPWIKPELVKWGYVPVTHDSEHYYCLIDSRPRTGTNIAERTFICGDPATVELDFIYNWKPKLSLYAGH